jgi:tetratricopeptide (TPR) repeat protein
MPLSKLENELQGYVRGDSFRKLVTRIQLENVDKLQVQPAEMFSVRTLQADLLSGLKDRTPDARKRYEELTREDPRRPEPWSGLGYIAWHQGNSPDAVTHFARAYELGARSPKLLWDYGRLAEGTKPAESARAFAELLIAEPNNSAARIELAAVQMSLRQYSAALETIRGLTSVSTIAERDRVLYIRAASALQAGDRTEARKIADELKRLTTSSEYAARADDVLRYLNQTER